MKQSTRLSGACLTVAASLWLTGCGGNGGAKGTSGGADGGVSVETVVPAREDLERLTEPGPAELLPFERTDLYALVSGFVKEIRVDIGYRVKKGDVLAVLSVPDVEAELAQKKAMVTKAFEEIEQAREIVKVAEANFHSAEFKVKEVEAGRTRALAEYNRWKAESVKAEDLVRRGLLDQQTLEVTRYQVEATRAAQLEVEAKVKSAEVAVKESEARWDKAKVDVKAAEARHKGAEADRDYAAAQLGFATVVAPYGGVVTARKLHTGAFNNARTSEQPVIFTVVRTDTLRVLVDVPQKDARFLDVAHPERHEVRVDLDGVPGRKFRWKITRFAPVLGPGLKVRAEVDVENPHPDPSKAGEKVYLYPGMYGHMAVVLEKRPGAFTLPVPCLGSDDKGNHFVWCVVGGKAMRRNVTIGLNDGEKAEITAGLTGDEEVIRSGRDRVREGQIVLARKVAAGQKK
jgi:RND family efflux transporter MFP subunit